MTNSGETNVISHPGFPSASVLTRRSLLESAAALGAAGIIGASLLQPSGVVAATPAAPTSVRAGRLVVVFLRGAADHLSITVPLDESMYQDARPTIAVDPDETLPLDDRFGFHPAMERLHARYQAGRLAPIVAVGNPAADRSHFLAQDLLERGSDGDDDLGDGWLARHLTATSTGEDGGLRAITVGANVDDSLVGYPAIGMLSLRTFGLAGAGDFADELAAVMRQAHDKGTRLDAVALQAIEASNAVAELPASEERNRTTAAFEDIVTLLEADLGTEVITVNIDGWDTHSRMGNTDGGDMRNLLADLDNRLGGMADALDDRGIDDVTTVVVTEFGRRVAENGSGGCDHGWGSAALLLGPSVNGGRVHGDWPGLDDDVVSDSRGDVPMTTDYRDVLGEAVNRVLGGSPGTAFPNRAYTPVGVFTDG
jgi:uncharacterized protein (DUF1501 family)